MYDEKPVQKIQQNCYPNLNDFKKKLEEIIRLTGAEFGADWFLNLIEPPCKSESPKIVSRKGSNSWEWPYEARVVNVLYRYIACDEDFKKIIIAAAEDKIYWRGDDKETFYKIIDEKEKMLTIGSNEYREKAIVDMKKMFYGLFL